ncbi:switch-associated protein 70-like [Cimex lectularius]|uniref:PH domain-containing protein n=1 Tax=Cimex lectularius TaxID=79782 RepID=A0A8I6S226_CIMLE|nr:switch-associated protein 70-like [Cimex lectularius]
MAALLKNVTNSIWHAFNSLSTDSSGNVMKSKLKVLTANIGTLLDLYGVEKGLDHFRSTTNLNFYHFKYYLLKEVFSSLPESISPVALRDYESRIDEVCWLVCKRNYTPRDHQILPDECVYHLFRVFCMLADLSQSTTQQNVYQVVMERSEVGLVTSQLVTSLGGDWNQESYDSLTYNTPGFKFSTLLTLLESKYLIGVDQPVLVEAITGLANTFLRDVIKKGTLMKRGYLLPTLREYWFVLQPNQLTYYKHVDEKEQCGVITLDPNCWVDSTVNRLLIHTSENRTIELAPRDHRSRLQWVSALQIAISQSGGSHGYQRTLAARRKKQREIDEAENKRKSSLIHDMGVQLQAEKMARVAAELEAREIKAAQEKQLNHLETLLEIETQAKRDEEIVRNLQARVLREEWEKREELERLQEEQRLLLEQERAKRREFEQKQREKEKQLEEAENRLRELEGERAKLDQELQKARDRIFFVEHTMTQEPTKGGVKVRRTMSFMPSTKDRP